MLKANYNSKGIYFTVWGKQFIIIGKHVLIFQMTVDLLVTISIHFNECLKFKIKEGVGFFNPFVQTSH